MYEDKNTNYFRLVRKDITPLLPAHVERVLEIGCGTGATLAWLKNEGRADWVGGIELNPAAAALARPRLNLLLAGDVDRQIEQLPPQSIDLILCLDVLEHLVDPWQTLQRIESRLRPGGQLIVSLPNIRHYSVLLPLLLRGRWQYAPAGIMDRTHLRFFQPANRRRTAATSRLACQPIALDLRLGHLGSLERLVQPRPATRLFQLSIPARRKQANAQRLSLIAPEKRL
ncbi:MAG: class I SAM-dependent methyltransferase [Rhodocyclales bacterium]|nr:class I SAM-dependent methyltransferase [Rhodocyclales bacterium]